MPDWAAAAVPGILVAIASGWLASRAYVSHARAELEAQVQARLDEARRGFYKDFVDAVMQILSPRKENDPPLQTDEIIRKLQELQPRVIMYASDDFVRLWNVVRTLSDKVGLEERLALFALLLQAIRKDLGYRQQEHQDPVQTLALFINDLIGNPELESRVRRAARALQRQIELDKRRARYGHR